MRSRFVMAVFAVVCALALRPVPVHATVPVVFGSSWDGVSLQSIVDATYGTGRINVQTDFIGAHPGDLDPWFWVDTQFSALIIREIAGNAQLNTLGWYVEKGAQPLIDGVDDGVVFAGSAGQGATQVITFDRPLTKFGFYLDPNGPYGTTNAPQGEYFFTNRIWNDFGPDGKGAIHAPYDGDVQAIVFDISNVVGTPNTWLVCFEDLDSGAMPKPCCIGTDNDFNDFVFEVHALGATPAAPMSFGSVKQLWR